MTVTKAKFASAIMALFFFAQWSLSPVHEFHLWPQVTFLRGSTPDFGALLTHAHLLRYLLVFPIFWLADEIGVDFDAIYRAFAFVLLFFISRNCSKIADFYNFGNVVFTAFFFALTFSLVSVFMNGRIIFAFCGFSYLLAQIHRWEDGLIGNFKVFTGLLISLFLCSVSTGTFLLCIICIMVWLPFVFHRRKGSLSLYITTFLFAISPLISFYILKNVTFYGGGFEGLINMLNHGAGVVLHDFSPVLVSLIVLNVAALTICTFGLLKKYKRYALITLFLAASAFAGLFGFSTLTLGLIPLSVILLGLILKATLILLNGSGPLIGAKSS